MNSFVTVLDQADHNLNEEWTYSDLVNVAIIMQYETNLNTNTMNETKMIVKISFPSVPARKVPHCCIKNGY